MRPFDRFAAFWCALDDRFELVEPTPWGAVVTDRRFPRVWDVNYARVETEDASLRMGEVERHLLPALEDAGAVHEHLVVFHPEPLAHLLTTASTRGARLSWDAVMLYDVPSRDRAPVGAAQRVEQDVEEVAELDEPFWATVRASLREFDVLDPDDASEVIALERGVLVPSGRRWFRTASDGVVRALGSSIMLDGLAFIDHVVTFPAARRRGYATAIVHRIVEDAQDAGAEDIGLLAEPGSVAEGLYRRLGFRTIATLGSTLERRPR